MKDLKARATQLFADALDIPEGERAAFLDAACEDDPELRAEIESLLAARKEAKDFFVRKTQEAGDLLEETEIRPAQMPGIVGHYEIHGKLGAGGMGEVYAATDRALGRKVAIKVLPADFRPEVRDRLMREAWASAKLQYPGIATFYEAGSADGVDFIAMEFVPGKTLREHLEGGPLELQRAIKITVSVLEALSHAHYSGILHRDIKPENIMIAEDGTPKLLDFGLARGLQDESEAVDGGGEAPAPIALDSDQMTALISEAADTLLSSSTSESSAMHLTGLHNLTQAGTVMGTFGYMPPEQLLGQSVDARTDIFAVGAVLYEMISGKPAFPGNTLKEKIEAILRGDPPRLEGPGMTTELNGFLARAIAKLPRDRYPSVSEFLMDLQEMQEEESRSSAPLTLAILKFEVSDPEDERAWMASALSQSIGRSVTRAPNVTLVPQQKIEVAMRGPRPEDTSLELHIGHTVGCNLVLSGHLDLGNERARVTFIDVTAGHPAFKEAFDISEKEVESKAEWVAMSAAASLNLPHPVETQEADLSEAAKLYLKAKRVPGGLGKNRFPRVQALLEQALEKDPEFVPALAELSTLHTKRYIFTSDPSSFEVALELADRAVASDPRSAAAWWAKSYALAFRRALVVEVIKCTRRAMDLDPENAVLPHFLFGTLSGVTSRQKVVEIAETFGEPIETGEARSWQRKKVESLLQRTLNLDPEFSEAWVSLAYNHMSQGNVEEATWCMNRCLATGRRAGKRGHLGEFRRLTGKFDEARSELMAALQELEETDDVYRDATRGVFLCALGRVSLDEDDPDAARAPFIQALQHLRGRKPRSAGFVIVQALAGLVRAGGEVENYEEAKRLFEERTEFDFTWTWGAHENNSLVELGKAARVCGRHEDAREFFERAREIGAYDLPDDS